MAVRKMGLRITNGERKELALECQVGWFFGDGIAIIFTDSSQGSSLGTYSTQWMNEFHWSARGLSAEDWLDEPKSRRTKLPWPSVKVIFPTRKIVQESVLGEPACVASRFKFNTTSF